MNSHPGTDTDAQMPNPEEEEDRLEEQDRQYESGEEDEDLENEDPSGVTPMASLSHESPIEYYPARTQEQQIEDRKRLERELLAQIKRDEQAQYLGGSNNGHNSKSTTPSPSSPPQTQYLYAANHPFAAAAAAYLTPSHMAAAAAAAAAQAAAAASAQAGHHTGALPTVGGGESSIGSATPPNNGSADDQSKYTFEEQFKQLYELSDDPRRKEFLDDLFSYMQKKGSPVNRIPIMAKQVLDLYELYRLVVARGGLVEVINKKIWREITKGLNLPSSITSAAFTLRTQYMKYLYAYECDREKLSTAEELQAAIDGNRREGRRSSYGPYGDMVNPAAVAVSRNSQHPPMSSPLSLVSRHVNGHGSNPSVLSSGRGSASPLPLAYYHNNNTPAQLPLNLAHQENGLCVSHGVSSGFPHPQENGKAEEFSGNYISMLENNVRNFYVSQQIGQKEREKNLSNKEIKREIGEEDNYSSVPSTPNPMAMPQQEALNLEVSRNSTQTDQKPLNMKRTKEEDDGVNTTKRTRSEEERLLSRTSMPSTHIKITSNRGPDGRTQTDGSLMVSMEVNGIMYQGVLFAAPNHRNRL